MWTRSRELRASAVTGLAKLAAVWVVALLGAVFMATAATADAPHSDQSRSSETTTRPDAPRTAGLVLVLALLGGGALVLTVGSAHRTTDEPTDRYDGIGDTIADDLPLALGLGLGFDGAL